jgi:hypothetical protein
MTNDERERLERAARACLEERYGRPLSDEEWARDKQALLEFGKLLVDWERQREKHDEPG